MMEGLELIKTAINDKKRPTRVFFRDDDAGWSDHRLQVLGDLIYSIRVPLDIAIIPTEFTLTTREIINSLRNKQDSSFHIHQHGYSHTNHEPNGRKCEFGKSRTYEDQYQDIADGRERLLAAFGDGVEPIFTPPWNRCTDDTVAALRNLGLQMLSRIDGSDTLNFDEVVHPLDVHIDWLKRRNGQRLGWFEFCAYAAKQFSKYDILGVMLHHHDMDNHELERFVEFVMLLKEMSGISFGSMASMSKVSFD